MTRVRHIRFGWTGALLYMGQSGACRALVRWDHDVLRYHDPSGSWTVAEWLTPDDSVL